MINFTYWRYWTVVKRTRTTMVLMYKVRKAQYKLVVRTYKKRGFAHPARASVSVRLFADILQIWSKTYKQNTRYFIIQHDVQMQVIEHEYYLSNVAAGVELGLANVEFEWQGGTPSSQWSDEESD